MRPSQVGDRDGREAVETKERSMLHAGDAGPLPFTLRWEQSQIWLPDASSGSPAGSSSHANPSEG